MISVLAAGLFFGSVLLHESAHAVMARGLDLPVSGITLVFWGGATETKASARGPLGEFLVAFVGPATTLALAGAFWVGEPLTNGLVAETMASLAYLSLIFAAFNALPGFPLDGGRMLLAAVWGLTGDRRTAMRVAGFGGIASVWPSAPSRSGSSAPATMWAPRCSSATSPRSSSGPGGGWTGGSRSEISSERARRRRHATATSDRAGRHHARTGARRLPARGRRPGVPGDRRGGACHRHGLDRERASGRRSRSPSPGPRGHAHPDQTPVLAPDETLDDALEWLGGREGLVLRDGVLVGALGPDDVERWYGRVVEGRATTPRSPCRAPRHPRASWRPAPYRRTACRRAPTCPDGVGPSVSLRGGSIRVVTAPLSPDERQSLVLEHASGTLLVTGAAGTGKSSVLRERFARLVEDGADPDRVALVVGSSSAREAARSRCCSACRPRSQGCTSSRCTASPIGS